MTPQIHLCRRTALLGLKIIFASFHQPLFSPTLPLYCSCWDPASGWRGIVLVSRMCLCLEYPQECICTPHLGRPTHGDLLALSPSTCSVSCQKQAISIQCFARFGDLHSQSLSVPYLLINNARCLFLVKFYLINKYYYGSPSQ